MANSVDPDMLGHCGDVNPKYMLKKCGWHGR